MFTGTRLKKKVCSHAAERHCILYFSIKINTMSLSIGSRIPSFQIYDSDKQIITDQDLLGSVTLILFFPAAFSGGCTTELCSVRDDMAAYDGLSARVLAISTDAVFSLNQFKNEQKYGFTLASDYNKELCGQFGAQYEEFVFGMKGTAKRSAFVIDASGIIRYAEVLDKASDMPNFEAIKSALTILEVKA